MAKTYSVATARNQLSRLIREAEAGGPIELTRRGRPVAVVVSLEEYQKLSRRAPDLFEVISDLRSRNDMAALAIDPDEVFGSVRSRDHGRDFSW